MAKIIALSKYRKNKFHKSCKNLCIHGPIYFHDLNDGIKKLAYKYMDTIIQSIQDNLIESPNHQSVLEDSQRSYITQYLNVKDSFSIYHEVKLLRGYQLKDISENDWNNITDIIIRLSAIIYYNLWKEEVQPIHFVDQYTWTSIHTDPSN
ncbi:hypothetical protein [Crassaminicella profunda]|uniref:hypothetical protein n=1 Tax=Crassaminicella profunda TaxID=1286698 RepID=UPI001CA628D6|nr:hypothetical protein [Crassaminicella profunda]QZY56521.1 hypothetical protein K7H06_06245 [Crassaminicella profunda]